MCGGERFWLSVLARRLVVLALVLFFAVSVTDASPIIALDHLRRDLGALQAQLEQIDAVAGEDAAQPVELDTDLGDGSPAFRRQILVTIASAACATWSGCPAPIARRATSGAPAMPRRCRSAFTGSPGGSSGWPRPRPRRPWPCSATRAGCCWPIWFGNSICWPGRRLRAARPQHGRYPDFSTLI